MSSVSSSSGNGYSPIQYSSSSSSPTEPGLDSVLSASIKTIQGILTNIQPHLGSPNLTRKGVKYLERTVEDLESTLINMRATAGNVFNVEAIPPKRPRETIATNSLPLRVEISTYSPDTSLDKNLTKMIEEVNSTITKINENRTSWTDGYIKNLTSQINAKLRKGFIAYLNGILDSGNISEAQKERVLYWASTCVEYYKQIASIRTNYDFQNNACFSKLLKPELQNKIRSIIGIDFLNQFEAVLAGSTVVTLSNPVDQEELSAPTLNRMPSYSIPDSQSDIPPSLLGDDFNWPPLLPNLGGDLQTWPEYPFDQTADAPSSLGLVLENPHSPKRVRKGLDLDPDE